MAETPSQESSQPEGKIELPIDRRIIVELHQTNEQSARGFWARYKDLWVPLGSLVVAFITIQSTFFTTRLNNELQLQMKQLDVTMKDYELNFKNKQEAYTAFMVGIADSYANARSTQPTSPKSSETTPPSKKTLHTLLSDLDTNYYRMEPFLDKEVRDSTWNALKELKILCEVATSNDPRTLDETFKRYIVLREKFRDQLYPALFSQHLDGERPIRSPATSSPSAPSH